MRLPKRLLRLLYSMDLTVLHLAVPQLTADLRPSGAQLLDAAHGAFVGGMQPTAIAGAAGALGLALFVAVALRGVPAGGG